ncbi:MAG TPA: serine hydrolase [Gaiellaceae bacterium]|nr:serine hydrolase [Gaiellaceae bacterium]
MALLASPPPAPVVVSPAAYEISFGRVIGRVSAGTQRVVVSIDGRIVASKDVGRKRFDFAVPLPARDVRLTVSAVDGQGHGSSTTIGPVFSLPAAAEPRGPPRRSREDPRLARTIRSLARAFPGICGVYVQDLRTGAGAAWNAGARFPAASTVKVAIAIEVLRRLGGKPPRGSRLDRLLRKAIVPSDDRAANDLLTWLGGSTSGGAAYVNHLFRALDMHDTDMYGGYIVQQGRIPIRTGAQPSFIGKRTTAADLTTLMRSLNLAAVGQGVLARRGFRPSQARFLLYLLAHSQVSRIDRFLPPGPTVTLQKAGWISTALHDTGLVYWSGGSFVATVLTWNARGTGVASDLLAGRIGRAAYLRFGRG